MLNETQLDFVIRHLNMNGYVTRNECLQNYISRLGALINILEKKGYKFQAKYIITPQGKDYKYTLLKNNQPTIL